MLPQVPKLSFPIPFFWENIGHAETAARALLSRAAVLFVRERIETEDGDFLDLDWHPGRIAKPGLPLVVYSHGLEGNSHSTYLALTIQALDKELGWPSLAWNYRSCSEEMNRRPRFYHMGEAEDLRAVLRHAKGQGYTRFVLVGFSAGGSITLNFLGKHPQEALDLGVVAAAVISTPLDLLGAADQLETPGSLFYDKRFCHDLIKKVKTKAALLGDAFPLSLEGLEQATTLRAFDDLITAPLHGFASATDYYTRCSGLQYLPTVAVPTLVWSALNDPFLSPSCFPKEALGGAWPNVQGHFSTQGGHCGFALSDGKVLLKALRPGGFWEGVDRG
jgi:predicted alpha/beta-fold hydrolase